MAGPGTSMRVIVSSTGISRPSACIAVISTRRPSRRPAPRVSPSRWRSRRCGGTSTAPSSRPIRASGACPKISSTARLTSTIRPSQPIVITASSAASSIARLRASLSCTAASARRWTMNCPASRPRLARVASRSSSGACTGAVRNSIAPPVPVSGSANAACRPASAASPRRGKFSSAATSAIHAGPPACTRPGRPSPAPSTTVRETAAKRSSAVPSAVQVATHSSAPSDVGSQSPP